VAHLPNWDLVDRLPSLPCALPPSQIGTSRRRLVQRRTTYSFDGLLYGYFDQASILTWISL
jgi:hypothetical protein